MFKRSIWKIVHHSTPPQSPQPFSFSPTVPQQLVLKNRSKSSFMDLSNNTNSKVKQEKEARDLCRKHLGGIWKTITPQDISVTPMTGGMSNTLLHCSLPVSSPVESGEPSQVLVRIYGDHNRDDDKSVQLEIFSLLSSAGLGPKLYGAFEDGRIEEYIPAEAMTLEEMIDPQISSVIAKKLAMISTLEVPLDKNNLWIRNRYEEFINYLQNKVQLESYLANSNLPEETKVIARELSGKDLRAEREFIIDILDQIKSPVVFSHNDLHHANILLAKTSKKRPTLNERVILIDFEYSSYNYRSFDLANHLSEWCFKYDSPEYPYFIFYPEKFPTQEQQRVLVRDYLNKRKELLASQIHRADNGTSSRRLTNGDLHSTVRDSDLDEEDTILAEIKILVMAVNLSWSIWCMKCAHQSTIKFGFWEHALARWKLYSDLKSKYLRHT